MGRKIKEIDKVQQQLIVAKTDCAKLQNSVGYPKTMSGVKLNLKTGKYEQH